MPSWGLKTLLGATALPFALGATTLAAHAADLPRRQAAVAPVAAPVAPPIDIAFGFKALTDYNFRGISQSDRGPAVQGYVELQAFDNLFYTGVFASTVDLATRPDAEVDLTIGIRPKLGPLSFDIGAIRYWYPNETALFDITLPGTVTPADTDFTELAFKGSATVAEIVTLGGNVFYAWDWLGTGADATYVSGTVKIATPFEGFSISGELGHYFIGTATDPGPAFDVPDYTYWNVGASYTFKNVTFDVRYHDTDATRAECFLISADPRGIGTGATPGRSRWCDPTVVASVGVDFTASQLGVFAPR